MFIKKYHDKRTRTLGMHLMSTRRLFGPTSDEAQLKRMPYNKGNPPPPNAFYMIPNPTGAARSQEHIADIVRNRLAIRNQKLTKE
jgi:hypothetical protein